MKVVAALVPFVGMFVVFVVVLRAIIFSDRREREAIKRLEAIDARDGIAPSGATGAEIDLAGASAEKPSQKGPENAAPRVMGAGGAQHDETP